LSTIDDIELTVQISPFVLWFSRAFEQIFNPYSAIVDPVARPPRLARMAGRHAHLRGLATAIHEIFWLVGHLVNCLLAIWPNPFVAEKDQIF